MIRVLTIVALLLCSVLPNGASAQTATDTTTARDSTRAPELTTVRVTGKSDKASGYTSRKASAALKTTAPLVDIPQSITVIGRQLIHDQGMQGMSDVVRYVPGITMGQGEGNRDQPTIRGNSTTADFFVDGVRDDAQFFRDLYNVDRVEALKGSNAMLFGRGGGGGVINRVIKVPEWMPVREMTIQGGSFENRRGTVDVGQGISALAALRLNAMYENSGTFRDAVTMKRRGINPTIGYLSPSQKTRASLGYENFLDRRTADRGIPSFDGRPVEVSPSTFFGDPSLSSSYADVHAAAGTIAHESDNGMILRAQTRVTAYRKKYQNIFPGAVADDGLAVNLSAYNNSHTRRNLFSQADLIYPARVGRGVHRLLVGVEVGNQATDNFRNTGYFGGTSTTLAVPVSRPTVSAPVIFRQSATDADNRVTTTVRSVYAQDEYAISEYAQLIAGLRYEKFGIAYKDNRSGSRLERNDALASPRFGVVLKPVPAASLYASYSVSFLPSAGDQFSSLTDVTKGLEPERFHNVEIGGKWDVADRLALTVAAYRLDRTNTKAPAPDNPGLTVQTGRQRSTGYELGANGSLTAAWQVAAAFSRQNAIIASTTTNAVAGARVPLVPAATLSLWNRFQLTRSVGVGAGVVHQRKMFAALDNSVILPAFNRADAALFFGSGRGLLAQINVENLFDEKYFASANGNNNISPGSPRAIRLTLTTSF